MSTEVETDKMAALATAANEARGLAMDSIAAAHSGHMGLPLGAAEIGATLYGGQVRNKYIIKMIVVRLDLFLTMIYFIHRCNTTLRTLSG